jgi:hypothetical protein
VLLAAAVLVSLIGQLYRPASATLLSDLTADDQQVMTFTLYRFGLNLGATAAPCSGSVRTAWPATAMTWSSRVRR